MTFCDEKILFKSPSCHASLISLISNLMLPAPSQRGQEAIMKELVVVVLVAVVVCCVC